MVVLYLLGETQAASSLFSKKNRFNSEMCYPQNMNHCFDFIKMVHTFLFSILLFSIFDVGSIFSFAIHPNSFHRPIRFFLSLDRARWEYLLVVPNQFLQLDKALLSNRCQSLESNSLGDHLVVHFRPNQWVLKEAWTKLPEQNLMYRISHTVLIWAFLKEWVWKYSAQNAGICHGRVFLLSMEDLWKISMTSCNEGLCSAVLSEATLFRMS